MKSAFISDLHLNISEKEEGYSNFIDFLKRIEALVDKLYILGDFFTFWYEHPKLNLAETNPALAALKAFAGQGKEIYFIRGNRDFPAGAQLKEASGLSFIGEDIEISVKDLRVYLHHGDIFAKKDIRYTVWRALIRSPISLFVFKHLPVNIAVNLADRLKKVGKKRAKKEEKLARIISENVADHFREGYDCIITGHAHYRYEKEYSIGNRSCRLIILPEFRYPGEILFADNEKIYFEKLGPSGKPATL